MNFTTTGNLPSTGNLKRIKGQYLAAIAGVALALTAVATLSSSAGQTAKPRDFSGRSSVSVAAPVSTGAPHSYIFIVADEAQKAQIDAADSELRALDPNRNDISVLVAGSPAAVSLQGEGARELMALGVPFTISDMTMATRPSSAEVTRESANAAITAGVLSTELAHFGS